MDKVVEKTVVDIELLKKVKKNLEEEVGKIQKVHSNLEAQAHTALVKGEQDEKLKNLERMTQYAVEERKLEQKRIQAESRIDLAEQLERKLNDRTLEVERRELKTLNLEVQITDLNNQRSNFQAYKTHVEEQLGEAKSVIAEANASEEKIKVSNDMLLGRETKVKQQEKYWNDLIGKLEKDKKEFQIEKENFSGLQKAKEVINV